MRLLQILAPMDLFKKPERYPSETPRNLKKLFGITRKAKDLSSRF